MKTKKISMFLNRVLKIHLIKIVRWRSLIRSSPMIIRILMTLVLEKKTKIIRTQMKYMITQKIQNINDEKRNEARL
jgi:hypothetical protein